QSGHAARRGDGTRNFREPRRHQGISRRLETARGSAGGFAMSEAADGTLLLDVTQLEAGYDDVQVLWGVSLKVKAGTVTTLVGANGAGKTTTLRAITGAIRPMGGRVMFEGEDVTRLATHTKTARGLVLVPEGRQLYSDMSVEENLEMGAYCSRA